MKCYHVELEGRIVDYIANGRVVFGTHESVDPFMTREIAEHLLTQVFDETGESALIVEYDYDNLQTLIANTQID